MVKRIMGLILALSMVLSLAACGSSSTPAASGTASSAAASADASAASSAAASADASAASSAAPADTTSTGSTEIQVFVAASLSAVMEDLAARFNETNPDITITFNADSSGTLLEQIENGFACDIFFSAAQKQMDALETDGLLVDGTRKNVLNNQVVVVKAKDAESTVTGLENIGDAASIALADGSVPVGKYTRTALMNLGVLAQTDDPSAYTTAEVSEALGGVEISEQGNVSKVRTAVVEGSCEVGTVYYSDTYGFEDQLDILQTVSYDLTGNVIYPVAQVQNAEADEAETAAAQAFYQYIVSDEAADVFAQYLFDTNVA